MNYEVKQYLQSLGCCWRCILIFLGETNVSKFQLDLEHLKITNDTVQDSSDINSKKLKEGICISCLGILHSCDSNDTLNKFKDVFIQGGYDSPCFSLALSLPVSLGLRIYTLWAQLLSKYPTLLLEVPDARQKHLGVLKDIWRNLIGPKIGSAVAKTFVSGQVIDFSLTVHAEYADDEKECELLERLDPQKFATRRKQHRKYNEGLFTRQVVEDTLKDVDDETFLELCSKLPAEPRVPASYEKIECNHSSIYLAGRYTKFSRELPQTPWMVEGERRFDSSVQEYICEPLSRAVKPITVKFSASGREDVDVRCLGRGRPFVIEFVNPQRTLLTANEILSLQNEVNASTNLINIKYLQIVSRKEISNLKDGEEEKTKSYCALCFAKEIITQDHLETINGTQELTIHQLTPIRVLHRRTLSSRDKIIHTMKTKRINDNFFKLYVKTQAGTYIKEFVHSDFGRTMPNLCSILGVTVDIIALDVEDIQLDWPPSSI